MPLFGNNGNNHLTQYGTISVENMTIYPVAVTVPCILVSFAISELRKKKIMQNTSTTERFDDIVIYFSALLLASKKCITAIIIIR